MKNILITMLLLLALGSCRVADYASYAPARERMQLSGSWQFALDPTRIGESSRWFAQNLPDSIQLPGTLDLRHKGFRNTDTTTLHLNRAYQYTGLAWYRRAINIPEHYRGRHLTLVLERTRSAQVWIDDVSVGRSALLQSPQAYEVSAYLTPGVHYLTIAVDNDPQRTPYGNVHINSDDTQTNWNGILGDLYLDVTRSTYLDHVRATADISRRQVTVGLDVVHPPKTGMLDIEVAVVKRAGGKSEMLPTKHYQLPYAPHLEVIYPLHEDVPLWSEFEQPQYTLTASVVYHDQRDVLTVPLAMRAFGVQGTQFTINGQKTFLRGKHEAAVFPLTGYPPMDVKEWQRVFRIAKQYGINHYRFHTYCPPEAAFTAADEVGIYIQAELPFWGGLESDTVARQLQVEGMGMLKAFANHPSFVMFSAGNEIWSGHDRVTAMMKALKAYDDRPLYAMGSNNNIGYERPRDYCDYFVGARVPDYGDSTLGHTRLTHAFADARQGGLLNTRVPGTTITFDAAVARMPLPLVSHEIGQYQVYPRYTEMQKYTGVLKPWNLAVFQRRLQRAGMGDLDSLFQRASGAWAAMCYKAEMEAALRTRGMAGFQLLDLQDFPGQGTALVGMLDAFMDSKHVVTPEDWRASCRDVALLLSFEKYCWTRDETFTARVQVANYSNRTPGQALRWTMLRQNGTTLGSGVWHMALTPGELTTVGDIRQSLNALETAEAVTVRVELEGTDYSHVYTIWVYPPAGRVAVAPEIVVADRLTAQVLKQLKDGAKVLLFPRAEDVMATSVGGLFPPEFWNYGMFKSISEGAHKPVSPGTLGVLMDPKHPMFRAFPTDFHTNWSWYRMVRQGRALVLDDFPKGYRPVVQVMDNLERNHKLGLVLEGQVGRGRLLVCMVPLPAMVDHPEAAQLYRSMVAYMESDDFSPKAVLDVDRLRVSLGAR